MRLIFFLKLTAQRILKRYGSLLASVLLVGIVCFCMVSSIEKEISEQAMEGFYSGNAISFSVNCDEPFAFWESVSFSAIQSLSYLDGDMEETQYSEHIKYISYRETVLLPPVKEAVLLPDAHTWNTAQGIAYAGKALMLRGDGENLYYACDRGTYQVQGVMGYYKTSYLDTMLYVPFDGIITPEQNGVTFIVDGTDRETMYRELQFLKDAGAVEIRIFDNAENERALFSQQNFILFFAVVCSLLFLYIIYLWFCALDKEMYILYLFGIPKTAMIGKKLLPLGMAILLPYCLGVAVVYGISPYFILHYGSMWWVGFAAMVLLLSATAVIGAIKVHRIKDASGKMK